MVCIVMQVLLNVGLCICFYDFVEIGEGYIYPSEGAAHRKGVEGIAAFVLGPLGD